MQLLFSLDDGMIHVVFERDKTDKFSNNRFGQLRFHRVLHKWAVDAEQTDIVDETAAVETLFSSSVDHPIEYGFAEDFEITDWLNAAMTVDHELQ